MKENHHSKEFYEIMRRSMEVARERSAVPPLRDVLKREHDEAQRRPRNEALEKWGPMIEAEIERDLQRQRRKTQPKRDGPDMDMD
jgi:hypothetical protein